MTSETPDNTDRPAADAAATPSATGAEGVSPPWQRMAAVEEVGPPPLANETPAAQVEDAAPADQSTTRFRPLDNSPDHAGPERTSINLGAGNVAPPGSRPTPSALRRPGRGPRRASLQIKRIDPWSSLKLALVLGLAMFLVWMVVVGVLYGVLQGMGVWSKLNGNYNDLMGGGNNGGELISLGRVFGVAAVIGVINVVLFTAVATVSTFIYNVSSDLVGGLEVTLSERE